MRIITVPDRHLVEFLLRSGSIDAGSRAGEIDAMQLGSDVHRHLQAMAEGPYQAELPLARSFYFPRASSCPRPCAWTCRLPAWRRPTPRGGSFAWRAGPTASSTPPRA